MKELAFVPVTDDRRQVFMRLMQDYAGELDAHVGRVTPPEVLEKWTYSIIARAVAERDWHQELCYDGEDPIGFLYGKVDHPGDKGYVKPGYGYVMEFYVLPERRRRGVGRALFGRLETLFEEDGVERLYLTADPVTGRPFWEAMGFVDSGETSPENGLPIYEKEVARKL